MSGTAIFLAIFVPVLAIAGFGVWIGAVHYADRHPRNEGGGGVDYTVHGGAFQGSGRQVSPRRDAEPPEARDYRDNRHAGGSRVL